MSSESNGRKPKSSESDPAPPSAGERRGVPGVKGMAPSRASERVASAWGSSRAAVAAVHNLEALLRNAVVPHKTILDLEHELRSSAAVLRRGVEAAREESDARSEVGAYGVARVEEIDTLLDAVREGVEERRELARRARVVGDELEAVIDLLALVDLASEPVSIEVSLDFVAREVGRMSATARGRELVVRFEEAKPDRTIVVDPYVLGSLLSLVVACVRGTGGELALRALPIGRARFVVEPAEAADVSLPPLPIRVMTRIEPSARTARWIAERLGATLELEEHRGSIALSEPAHD